MENAKRIKLDENDQNELFIDYCRRGNIKMVKSLLEMNIDPSIHHNEAIRLACDHGHIDIVKLLLNDSRVDACDEDFDAILQAARKGHVEIFQLLWEKCECNFSAFYHRKAFNVACRYGHIEIVKLLLSMPWSKYGYFSDVFSLICDNDDAELLKTILVHEYIDPSENDNDAIIDASYDGKFEIVKLLLADERVDPAAQDNTAIRYASNNGHLSIVQLLLSDPRVDPSDDNNAAIITACNFGHLDVVKRLLEDDRVDPSADNGLAINGAARNNRIDIVKLLLADPRVDPSANDNKAIRGALHYGYMEIVNLLLTDPRVDPSAKNNEALCEACRYGRVHVARILLNHPIVQDSLSIDVKKHCVDQVSNMIIKEANSMIPYYSNGFYEKYKLPDDVMHVILGEYIFGYTTNECMALQKLL